MLDDEECCPYATITTCLGEFIGMMFTTYVDTNNNPWAEDFLVENKIGRKTSFTKGSGYCTYPLYAINPQVVRELVGDEELEKYLKEFDFDGENNPWGDFEISLKNYNEE